MHSEKKPRHPSNSLKDQLYYDKLKQLKAQLDSLYKGVHPEYLSQLSRLQVDYNDRLAFNEVCHTLKTETINREYMNEKNGAVREFEEKKSELLENLLFELEEKKRQIEHEYQTLDLAGDLAEAKPMPTRKLRRRPHEPTPSTEKRPRPAPSAVQFTLSEEQIVSDLQHMPPTSLRSDSALGLSIPLKALSPRPQLASFPPTMGEAMPIADSSGQLDILNSSTDDGGPDTCLDSSVDDASVVGQTTFVEGGRLYHDQRWYQKGHSVYIENVDGQNLAIIQSINSKEVWAKRISDGQRMRVSITALQKGKAVLKRKST